MNKERREKIEKIMDEIQQLSDKIDKIKIEEEGALDNLPESVQLSERGEKMIDAMEVLDDTYGDLQAVNDTLVEAMN